MDILDEQLVLGPVVSKKERITGSEAMVRALIEEGVDTLFGYPGGAIMPFYDSLYGYLDKLNHILTRHEQGAIHAAQGYARTSGKVGVCVATSGPGATNLITGLADAMIDSTPLVCFTGQVASPLLGSDAFQETDVVGISMPVTKWNYQVTKAEEIPAAIAKAFYIAQNGRPGPVLLDITKDAQFALLDFAYKKCKQVRSYVPKPPLDEAKLKEVAELINKAERPYILFGQGVLLSGAEEELQQMAVKADIPCAATLLGLSAMPCTHPNYVGYLGMHGNYSTNELTNECDVLIAIGMRFDDRVTGNLNTYAKQAKVIHFEIDPAEIDKNVKTHLAVNADAKEALTALIPMLEAKKHDAWKARFKELDAIEHDKVIDKSISSDGKTIKMAEVIHKISEKTEGKAITVSDVGQHQMMTSRYYQYKNPHTNVTSGGLGTMGFSLPASLGAQLGSPDNTVIAIIGDGGFQMTIQELATISQFKIPVKIMVLNNEFLGMVRQWQEMFFDSRYSFTNMVNPDFVKVVQGFGISASRVTKPEDLDAALDAFLAAEGPVFLEVKVLKEDGVFPMMAPGTGVGDMRLE